MINSTYKDTNIMYTSITKRTNRNECNFEIIKTKLKFDSL